MTVDAASSFDTPMSSAEVVEQLWSTCQAWADKAQHFQALADVADRPGSRLQMDNAAAASEGRSLAVTGYVKERAWNAARMFRALHHLVFETMPGKLWVDSTVMYPLMRAALEDASAIRWLQSPDERKDRLTRAFRALVTDNKFYTENHRLLALSAASLGEGAADHAERLTAHMVTQKEESAAHFRSLAETAGLDASEAMRELSTSAPVRVEYGADSVEFVSWKFLSDLAHFSYMMLRHLATSPVPESDATLEHITMLHLAQTVSRIADDASSTLETSLRRDES